jgi:hypothetical protein
MKIGTLLDPESHPLWDGILALLEMAAARFGCAAWEPDETVWVAIDGTQIIAAATTRLLENGDAELVNVGGIRAREWIVPWETMICEWARLNGARRIISGGDSGSRKGWWRWVRPLGWTKQADRNIYEKVL